MGHYVVAYLGVCQGNIKYLDEVCSILGRWGGVALLYHSIRYPYKSLNKAFKEWVYQIAM